MTGTPKYFLNMCRLCANHYEETEYLLDLYDCDVKLELSFNFPEFVINDLQINLSYDEKMPTKICIDCLNIINKFVAYREKCKLADKKLKSLLQESNNIQISEQELEDETCDSSVQKCSKEEILYLKEVQLDDQEDESCVEETINQIMEEPIETEFKKQRKRGRGRPKNKTVNMKISINKMDQKKYTCEKCGKTFDSSVGFGVHKRMHYRQENGIKRVTKPMQEHLEVCYVCGKTFKQIGSLKLHLLFHKKVKPFECDICNKRYYTKSNLNDHKNSHSNEKKFKCESCSKAFFTYRQLSKHLVIHKETSRKIQCSMCPKKFIHPYQVQMHAMIHTGQKPYNCNICLSKFRFSWDLKKHMKKIHDQIDFELINDLSLEEKSDSIVEEISTASQE